MPQRDQLHHKPPFKNEISDGTGQKGSRNEYAKIETEKKMEMERKKQEIEELQRLKSYESVKADDSAAARLEEERKKPRFEGPSGVPVERG